MTDRAISCAEGKVAASQWNGRARSQSGMCQDGTVLLLLALNSHGLAADGLNWQQTGCMHRAYMCVRPRECTTVRVPKDGTANIFDLSMKIEESVKSINI